MNKLLDLLADIEGYVEMAVDDRKDRENIMDWVHQAMDIAVKNKAHKWPEEKPVVPDEVEFKVYLARYKIDDEFIFMDSVAYYKDTGWGTSGVTHWWELPEVRE